MKHYVYHIHHQPGVDLNIGYIGVTRYLESRFRAHRSGKSRVGRCIRKYGFSYENLRVVAVFESSDEAYALELQLRPNPRIGWNLSKGGRKADDTHQVPGASREKIRLAMTGPRNHRYGIPFPAALRKKYSLRMRGAANHRYGVVNDPAMRAKISDRLRLKPAEWRAENAARAGRGNLGKKRTEQHRENYRATAFNRPRYTCPHCLKTGQYNSMIRHHGDACKARRLLETE